MWRTPFAIKFAAEVVSVLARPVLPLLLLSQALSASPPVAERFSLATEPQAARVAGLCGGSFARSPKHEIAITETLVFFRLASNCIRAEGRRYCKTLVLRRVERTTCAFAAFTRGDLLFLDDLQDPLSEETYLLDAEHGALQIRSLKGNLEVRPMP